MDENLEDRVSRLEGSVSSQADVLFDSLTALREACNLLLLALDRHAETGVLKGSENLPKDIAPRLQAAIAALHKSEP
ncbi:MAG: hypothetical protein WCF24_04730 [Acidimicrobiales bacterium]